MKFITMQNTMAVKIELESSETIQINYITIGIDNVSNSLILPLDPDGKKWSVEFQLNNPLLHDGELNLKINFNDLVGNDTSTVDRTTNNSKVFYDNTPPVLSVVKLRSSNDNNSIVLNTDYFFLEF